MICESEISSRLVEVEIEGKKLITPTYFPAISSYGIKYSFPSLIRLFFAYLHPRLLISAYDLHFLPIRTRRELCRGIEEYSKNCIVFLDSGVYESYWRADRRWNRSLYKKSMASIEFDFYSSFDVLPGKDSEEFVKNAIDSILASRNFCDKPGFVPILHGISPDKLVLSVNEFVRDYPDLCNFVAVPERDCGNNVVEKAQTVCRIRNLLDDGDAFNRSRILHILGCGNPISLLLLSYCGANTFDSLDWIKHVVDPNRLAISDFSHLELMNCDCLVCANSKRHYVETVLLHNLLFYQNYMLQIQTLIKKNELRQLLDRYVGQNILRQIFKPKT